MKIVGILIASAALATVSTMAAAAQEPSRNVLVYDYAIDHPTEDAQLQNTPSIGASVPQNVVLATVEGTDGAYGYFYFNGQPVIVDLATRAIVRIGN